MAAIGARSVLWVIVAAAIVVLLAALAFAAWSLRPVPAYTSDGVETGTPFDVTFRIENTSQWFPLSHLGIGCVLRRAGVADMPPIAASDVQMPAGSSSHLGPNESATFKCPFRAVLRGTANDELGIALRSELYFRATYDLPLIGSFRLTDNRGPFVLNSKVLPPRWTGKPQGQP